MQRLLDSGASDNFISEDFARCTGFSKRQSSSPQYLTFADGSSVSGSGVVHSLLRPGDKSFSIHLLIAPLSKKFYVIIGRPRLSSHYVVWEFVHNSVLLRSPGLVLLVTVMASGVPSVLPFPHPLLPAFCEPSI